MADLVELIERLEKAEGNFSGPDAWSLVANGPFDRRAMVELFAAALQGSLDAALALAERVLEDRGPININVCIAGSAQAQIFPMDPCEPHAQVVAATPAVALCAAILRAKADERGKG